MLSSIRSLLLLLCALPSPAFCGWIERKAEGWAWYEDPEKLKKEEIQKPSSPNEEFSAAKKDLEEKLAKALLEPTHENVMTYMQEQQRWLDQSTEFAKVWSRLLLLHPYLDNTTRVPVSQYGLQAYKQSIQEQKEALISGLAKENGLFFFYEGENLASKVFAEVVKEFSKKYGWNVLAISVDGTYLKEFAESKLDNGISEKFGITVFPALVLINPKEEFIAPVSFGLTSLDKIEQNLFIQFSEREEFDDD